MTAFDDHAMCCRAFIHQARSLSPDDWFRLTLMRWAANQRRKALESLRATDNQLTLF